MGNTTTIGNVSPDLPPNITESNDIERLFTTFNLLQKRNCKMFIDGQYAALNSNKLSSDKIQRIKDLTSSCFLYHMDRSFYDCIHKQGYDLSTLENTFQNYTRGELTGSLPSSEQQQQQELKNVEHCIHKVQPVRDRINNILSDPIQKKLSLQHYEQIAENSQFKLSSPYEAPQQLRKKVQLAAESTCAQYYANKYMKNSDNMLRYMHYNSQFSRCMIAELCADQVLDCLKNNPESGGDLLKCYASPTVSSCYKRFRRKGDLEQMFPTGDRPTLAPDAE